MPTPPIIYRNAKGQALTAADHDANMLEVYEHQNGILLNDGGGAKGVYIGEVGNHGWHDLIGSPRSTLTSSPPTVVSYIGGIKQPSFAIGNEEVREFHIPHDYADGTNLFIHAHWSHNSTNVTSGSVTWQFECMSAQGHNTDAFYTPVVINVTQAASTERYRHMIAEVQLSEPAGVSMLDTDWISVDGLIIVACRLVGNTMTGGAVPFLHSFDIHYNSTNVATKNKAPNFYA